MTTKIKGAKEVLRVLEQKFKLGINLKKMSKDIIEIEEELAKPSEEKVEEVAPVDIGAIEVEKKGKEVAEGEAPAAPAASPESGPTKGSKGA